MGESTISVRKLLQAGAHYGHRVRRWNPKMRPFIHSIKGSIHTIDMRQTLRGLIKASHFLQRFAARGGIILFVGTKRQASRVVKSEAHRCGMPYVAHKWVGGTLTNYETIRNGLDRLKQIEDWQQDETMHRYSKTQQASIQREKRKLLRNLDGLRTMCHLPAALVIVDPQHEAIALSEAKKTGAATIALIDTDGDPEEIDIPIPGNDDSLKVVQIILNHLASAVVEGKAKPEGLPPGPEAIESPRKSSPPEDEGPGSLPVPAQLRPRPTPGRASAKRKAE